MNSEKTQACRKACGRLATAAVFVSVGVVQFIAGLILLKSKYVYLLSGPDIWTAVANLAVGILLGVSTSVWKDVQKTSSKHFVRRNLLACLVISAIIINSTTAIILILGEGNTLLSIQLEKDGNYSSTSEILAYSYATSICSPIVSVVVAIIFLSGMWFRVGDRGVKTPETKSILKKNNSNEYNWVFKRRQSSVKQDTKSARKELSFKSLSSSSEDESFSLTDAKLWSNTVRSIEYLNTSLQRDSGEMGIHRHCRECEHAKNTRESIPHERYSESFPKAGKMLKFSPYVSRSLLETHSPYYSDHVEAKDKNNSSLSYAKFKKMHKKRRILLTEHPAFLQSKGDMNIQNYRELDLPGVYIPRAHTRVATKQKLSRTSEVKADVHVEPESKDWGFDENTSELSIPHCEDDVPSSESLDKTVQCKNLQFQRSSTQKQLNSDVLQQGDAVGRKVWRTSTTAGPGSSKISNLDISDIRNDSLIDQNEPYESEEEKDITDATSPQSATLQMDSNIEIDDSFCEAPESNALAGEVVKVQVNSLPRTKFHSKLIPVPIPIVSSVKKKPLMRKQIDRNIKAPNKFSGRNENRFSSFYGDPKATVQESNQIKTNKENFMNEKYEAVDDSTICEISPDSNILPSPAQTSGYESAILENTHLSGSECFKPHLSGSETNSLNFTPKRKIQNLPSPRNLINVPIMASK